MKARTVLPAKTLAAYGLGEQKLAALSVFCDREGIRLRVVSPDEAGCTVGALCGLSGESRAAASAEPPAGECLIFAGFDRSELGRTVNSLRAAGVTVTLKSVCTPHNISWTLSALFAELEKEHAYMSGRGGAE